MSTHSLLHTEACVLLGIDLPIIQAPMAGGWTSPELVAAVSNAGGLGSLAAGRLSTDALRKAIARTSELTDRPFAVNFLIPRAAPLPVDGRAAVSALDPLRRKLGLPAAEPVFTAPDDVLDEQLALTLDAGVRVVSFAMGNPAPFVDRINAAGALVVATVTTVEEAKAVERAGADLIVAQGAEAGGHRSTFDVGPDGEVPLVGTMALVPQVVDAVRRPVLASGGIADARGLLAALALGAAGAQIGTRFLAAKESAVFDGYRRRVLEGLETDTVVTQALTGRPARAIRNGIYATLREAAVEPLPYPYQSQAAGDVLAAAVARDDAESAVLLAGQGLRMVREVEPAAEIVSRIAEGAAALIRGLAAKV